MNLIDYFEKKKLLADGKTNTKMAKNKTKTYGLSLIPHSLNSKKENICKFSTKECRAMCLNMTGRAGFNSVQMARRNKTDFFVYHRKEFLDKLYGELETINRKGEKCLVRLNVVSDVDWNEEFKNVGKDLSQFKKITFYNYTKDPFRIVNNSLKNQHFTYSYSGGNWNWCERFLNKKEANVAIVFKGEMPKKYKGYTVINGDVDDERVLDKKGRIVGLRYKVPRGVKYQPNKFVIEV
jgi:hypothetical protein